MDPSIYQSWLIGLGVGTLIAAVVGGVFLKAKGSQDARAFAVKVGSLWPGALMLGVAAVAGWVGLMGVPRWPATASDDRLGWVFMLVTVISVFAGLLQRSFAVRMGLAVLAAVFAVAFTMYSPSTGLSALGGKMTAIAIGVAGVLLGGGALCGVEWRDRRVGAAVILTGMALAIGASMMGSGSSKLGFMAWSLVPAGAIAVLICALRKGAAIGTAGIMCAACVLGATVVVGYTYSELKPVSAAIFALCPVLALVADATLTPILKPRMSAALVVLAAAIPAAVAIGLSVRFE